MKFIFRKAQKQELNKALNLLFLAAQRLKEKGVNQWRFWLNPSQEKINWVEEGFTNQEFYFVQNQDQEIFAMFRLMPKDELYWGKQEKNAFYIHSLVVDPAFAGKQIGQQIIWQIETELIEKGVFTLRLDCNSASLSLCQYYEKLGFRKVGEKQMPDSLNNLYEKELPESKNQTKTFYASSRQEWRMWLEKNHQTENSVWLIIYRKESAISSVYYSEAVDEALCFGWIDSKANKRNELSFYQFFSKRNPKSNWSKVNKEKIAKLEKQGLLTASGLEMVEIAQKTGTWTALDLVENIHIPADLQTLFDQNKAAFENWGNFSRSSKRGILEWILNAKREETRQKRIKETVTLAEKNLKANQFIKKN